MPMRSQAQNAAMHAAEEGRSTIGIPQSVGAKFVSDQKGKPVKGLPKRVGGKTRGGIINPNRLRPRSGTKSIKGVAR
jgi:hypothetical protein